MTWQVKIGWFKTYIFFNKRLKTQLLPQFLTQFILKKNNHVIGSVEPMETTNVTL